MLKTLLARWRAWRAERDWALRLGPPPRPGLDRTEHPRVRAPSTLLTVRKAALTPFGTAPTPPALGREERLGAFVAAVLRQRATGTRYIVISAAVFPELGDRPWRVAAWRAVVPLLRPEGWELRFSELDHPEGWSLVAHRAEPAPPLELRK